MKKFRKLLSSPKATTVIFGAAIALLLFSSIGGARAALTVYSQTHQTEIETDHIAVTLWEAGREKPVIVDNEATETETRGGVLELKALRDVKVGEISMMVAGKDYPEVLSVQNTGEIDQYTRVTIYKYWVDNEENSEEKKTPVRSLWPGYIELTLADGWVVDTAASTPERTVIYYKNILKAGETPEEGEKKDFVTSMRIDPEVMEINGGEEYKDHSIRIEVNVDAVQTHHAADAVKSSWGCNVVNGSAADPETGVLQTLEFDFEE